ncbi:unnamed protein product [Gongylonema pulchrum]|uniref:Uncharacterized protein n=1 Tax=Gongylonema pulchrum TaxID=637853 RepID=A0A183ED70_9BILA|nr:unnamed protein product [Gongylonema pulchrum]
MLMRFDLKVLTLNYDLNSKNSFLRLSCSIAVNFDILIHYPESESSESSQDKEEPSLSALDDDEQPTPSPPNDETITEDDEEFNEFIEEHLNYLIRSMDETITEDEEEFNEFIEEHLNYLIRSMLRLLLIDDEPEPPPESLPRTANQPYAMSNEMRNSALRNQLPSRPQQVREEIPPSVLDALGRRAFCSRHMLLPPARMRWFVNTAVYRIIDNDGCVRITYLRPSCGRELSTCQRKKVCDPESTPVRFVDPQTVAEFPALIFMLDQRVVFRKYDNSVEQLE